MLKKIVLMMFVVLSSATTPAESADKSPLVISQAQARATVGKMSNSAAFLQIENQGKSEDTLLSASSPVASRVDIHSMSKEGDVMKMRAVDRVAIKPGEKITMLPGQGYHLMLMELKTPLKIGEKIPLTLVFRHAGKLNVTMEVIDMAITGKQHGEHGTGKDDDLHNHHKH